ncbi:MAG: M20 family metallopeptidase, partial [Gammaproteobacteria bacterium]|nr:M20 family metallopeptidase [Gammaproteobacteria bacterium]
MSREAVIERLLEDFDKGVFVEELARRVAIRSESQIVESHPNLWRYLREEIGPELQGMGYEVRILPNPVEGGGPFLIARRLEDPALPTVLTYGHGDVIRGLEGQWSDGRDPWTLEVDGERIYGRGVADNKGQHTVNLQALRAVIAIRGALGFNSVVLFETGEEMGSRGLHELCEQERDALRADLLLASDGPRFASQRPTLFMGTRGALNFEMRLELRDGGHHSGNWGGLLRNPGVVLANAIASLVDQNGRVRLRSLVPEHMPNSVRAALSGLEIVPTDGEPDIDPDYGEPGLTPAEKVYGWNTFEVLAFLTGNPDNPVNAIPPRASAHCQIRYTVDTDEAAFLDSIREHLTAQGFGDIEVRAAQGRGAWPATRLDPEHPWVEWAASSIQRSVGMSPVRLPNLGGSLPNDAFANVLGLPTIFVPHSYPGCSQHAPDEHGLKSIFREVIVMMFFF